MKYEEFKRIAHSEGFEMYIDPDYPDELVLDSDSQSRTASINLGTSNDYRLVSYRECPLSVRMATAIAEFAATPWIEREVPDEEMKPDDKKH